MRAAIIGTGGIAHTHAASIRALGHTVGLVGGHSLSSAESFARKFGCDNYSNTLTASDLKDIDCVHICLPPEFHGEIIRLCLQEGKPVLCEKPLSLRPEEAEELASLAEERGVVAAVDFNNRFYPACAHVRKAVAEMDRVVLVQGHYRQEFHMLPTAYSWRYADPLRATTEIGSHFIDLMRYLTGAEVEAVSAAFLSATPERRVRGGIMYPDGEGTPLTVHSEDAALVTFRLSGGALASAVFSEISPGRGNDLTMEISSTQDSVSWCSEHPYQTVTGRRGEGLTTRSDPFGGGFTDTFTDCFQAMYRAIETGERDPRLASFRDGAVNARICNAIARSAASGGGFVEV